MTPIRTIRVPDELWAAARLCAASRGETVTAALVRALEVYLEEPCDP